jgi:hypothetical protein
MWKLKDKHIHKYIHDHTTHTETHTHNMFVIVGLFEGTKGRQERTKESE